MLDLNPGIYNIEITPCSAGFSPGCSALGMEQAGSAVMDYQDTKL